MLDRMTIAIIKAIKHTTDGNEEENIARAVMKITYSPREAYPKSIITRMVEQTFEDLANNVQFASSIIDDYFSYIRNDYSHFDAMCTVLHFIQVKEKDVETGEYYYVNGFWDMGD